MNDASLMSNFVSALVLLLTWHWYCTIIGLKSADSYIACLDKIKMILKVHTRADGRRNNFFTLPDGV